MARKRAPCSPVATPTGASTCAMRLSSSRPLIVFFCLSRIRIVKPYELHQVFAKAPMNRANNSPCELIPSFA